jgi:hypothetical protein
MLTISKLHDYSIAVVFSDLLKKKFPELSQLRDIIGKELTSVH